MLDVRVSALCRRRNVYYLKGYRHIPPALRNCSRRDMKREVYNECELGSGERKAVAKRWRAEEKQEGAEGRWKSFIE